MVEVDHLTRYYGNTMAIEDVTFTAQQGSVLCFLGPNAAGKTTTMRIMTGFMPPTSGTARICGYDIVTDSVEARRHLGYLPEAAPLYEDMTVYGYLDFCLRLRGLEERRIGERIDYVLDATNITERADWIIGKLSKGFRRRVGLAQALVHDPPVLILDEPSEGLDPLQIIEIRKLIRSLATEERTIILSTHILPEAQQLADSIVIIHRGRVVATDTPDNLTARLQDRNRIHLTVEAPRDEVLAAVRDVAGVEDAQPVDGASARDDGAVRLLVETPIERDARADLAAAVAAKGWPLLELEAIPLTLEDIFIRTTDRDESIRYVDDEAPAMPVGADRDSSPPEDDTGESAPDDDESESAEE